MDRINDADPLQPEDQYPDLGVEEYNEVLGCCPWLPSFIPLLTSIFSQLVMGAPSRAPGVERQRAMRQFWAAQLGAVVWAWAMQQQGGEQQHSMQGLQQCLGMLGYCCNHGFSGGGVPHSTRDCRGAREGVHPLQLPGTQISRGAKKLLSTAEGFRAFKLGYRLLRWGLSEQLTPMQQSALHKQPDMGPGPGLAAAAGPAAAVAAAAGAPPSSNNFSTQLEECEARIQQLKQLREAAEASAAPSEARRWADLQAAALSLASLGDTAVNVYHQLWMAPDQPPQLKDAHERGLEVMKGIRGIIISGLSHWAAACMVGEPNFPPGFPAPVPDTRDRLDFAVSYLEDCYFADEAHEWQAHIFTTFVWEAPTLMLEMWALREPEGRPCKRHCGGR